MLEILWYFCTDKLVGCLLFVIAKQVISFLTEEKYETVVLQGFSILLLLTCTANGTRNRNGKFDLVYVCGEILLRYRKVASTNARY